MCSSDCHGTHYIDQAGSELKEVLLPRPRIKGVHHYTSQRRLVFKQNDFGILHGCTGIF